MDAAGLNFFINDNSTTYAYTDSDIYLASK